MFGVINGLRDWLMNPIQNQTTCAKMLSPNVYQVTLFNVETSRIKKSYGASCKISVYYLGHG